MGSLRSLFQLLKFIQSFVENFQQYYFFWALKAVYPLFDINVTESPR